MNDHEKVILSFPREMKIKVLQDSLNQGNLSVFLGLSKVLLDAPISEGGIETEVIERIHQDHLDATKVYEVVLNMEDGEMIDWVVIASDVNVARRDAKNDYEHENPHRSVAAVTDLKFVCMYNPK